MTTESSKALAHPAPAYEPPTLTEIGGVHELTLGCWHDKKWGGSDGLKWMGINIPVSSC